MTIHPDFAAKQPKHPRLRLSNKLSGYSRDEIT